MQARSTTSLCVLLVIAASLVACARGTASSSSAPAAAQPRAAAAGAALPEGITLAMVTVGDSIFHKGSCQRCHGMDAKGTERGPNLTDDAWSQISGSYADIVQIVTTGVPKEKVKMPGAPFAMRARGGMNPPLTDEQVRQVAAYVFTLSHH